MTARGYNVKGTFAYFRSYQSLPKKIDALYVGPLWGIETAAIREFFAQVQRDHIPTFSADGRVMVERGALASVAAQNITMPARFAAWKTARIIEGAIPADLPTTLNAEISWSMNETAALVLGIRIPDNVRMHGYVVPTPPDSEEVTLSIVDALERARQQNTGYLATYDRIRAAAASAGQARSALLPELSADASLFYADDNTVANERDLSSNERAIGNLRMEWTPFSLEAIRAAQSIAKRERIAQIDQTAANLDLANALTAAFSAAYHATQAVAAQHDYLQAVEQAIEVATVRATYETNERFDLSRLQSEQYSATVAFRQSEADRDVAQNLLNSLLGQPPDQPLRLNEQNLSEKEIAREIAGWQIVAPDKPARNAIAEYLTKIAGENNPQMTRSRTVAEQKRLDIARSNAGRLPRLGFSARLSYVDSLANVAGFEEKHTVGRVGATLSLPIFFGNHGKRERDELKATISEIEYKRDNTRLDIARQISDNLLKMYTETYTIVTIAQAEPLASEHYGLAVARFNKTPGTVNDLLDAARNLRDVRLSLLANVHEYLAAGAALLQLTGWSIGPDQITPGDALLTHLAAQFPVPEDER